MLGNNIKALFIHLLICILVWSSSNLITDAMVKGDISAFWMNGMKITLVVLGMLLYTLFSKFFIKSFDDKLNLFLSVSIVPFIGISLWVYCFYFTTGGWGWLISVLYNSSVYPLMSLLEIKEEFTIFFLLFPLTFLILGLVWQKIETNKNI